jgi:hypothetical protein
MFLLAAMATSGTSAPSLLPDGPGLLGRSVLSVPGGAFEHLIEIVPAE